MYATNSWINNINKSDILPPLTAPKKIKESEAWKKAVLDSFEHIGLVQLRENLKFYDYYRMVEGKMSYQSLAEVFPHMETLQDLLDGVGIPTFLKHYDIIGVIINALVGKYIDMQDKFHVTDTGEIAQNEFLRFKTEELQKTITEVIDNEVNLHLAKNGLNPEGKQFQSQEEQQQFIQQLEQAKEQFTPKDTLRDGKKTFKTVGVQWGEATLDKDKEMFNLGRMEKNEFKDFLISGRCFREYKVYGDKYGTKTWSPKNTFFSKEIDLTLAQKGQYIGRIHFYTPSEIITEYGHLIPTDKQKELLGGNESWKNFVGDGVFSGNIEQAIGSNFNKQARVPFGGYFDYNFMLGLQDDLDIPMGVQTIFNPDGTQTTQDRYIPRIIGDNSSQYNFYAQILRDDFTHRKDLCQTTEVYFRAYDKWGYLTYENEYGRIVTEEVTEDILPQFLKDNGIKQTSKESLHDIITSFEPGTLKWQYRPVVYKGLKVQSGNLREALYLYCEELEFQPKGDSDYDVDLPVAGLIGDGVAQKIDPFQAKYNFCMNQIYSLLEKELGMFFLMDTALIPSEYQGYGDAEEALMHLRNTAKETGIMPIATSGDQQKNQNNFNQFSTYNISYVAEIRSRVEVAEFCQRKAYEVIGINPTILTQPTKYETAEGVRMNNESSFAQVSDLYDDFNHYNRGALELHLTVAQYAQSNKKDLSLYYTKSDASIQYLKLNDPNFPLRRIGLIPTVDSRKRKELQELKTYLMNTNTLGSDTLEIAKLFGSDAYSEVVEIARIEREERRKQEEEKFKRDQTLIQDQKQSVIETEQARWEREEITNQRDRETDIYKEEIKAKGRAAGQKATSESFSEIEQSAQAGLKMTEISSKETMEANKLKQREIEVNDARSMKIKEFELKTKELEEKRRDRQSKEYIATINKN